MGIGDVAALVTVAGVLIYVLGLVGLAMPISRDFTGDLTTAWYAVSLLPRTVVAGQGTRVWGRWPFLITAMLLLSGWLLPTEFASPGLALIGSASGFYVSLRAINKMNIRIRKGDIDRPRWRRSTFRASLLGSVGAVLVAVAPVLGEVNPLIYIPSIVAGSFLIGLPLAITADPPLPTVEITKHAGATMEENTRPTNGHLLAHSDGFWHVLLKDSGELQSIPDEQVLVVRTGGKASKTPAEKEAASKEVASPEEAKPGEGGDG